jgi:hypothetical protein
LWKNKAQIGWLILTRDMTCEQWQRIVDISLWGVIYGAQEVYGLDVVSGAVFGRAHNPLTSSKVSLLKPDGR